MALDKLTSDMITAGAVDAAAIADGTVVAAEIASDAVTTVKVLDANVTTAKLADNAVTLAKMAGGTDGQIITYDASGDPVAVGPGTDGQVLTSTGAGSPPAFEALPASGLVFNDTYSENMGDSQTTTSTTYADVLDPSSNVLEFAITPSATSSRIFFTGSIPFRNVGYNTAYKKGGFKILGKIGGGSYATLQTSMMVGNYGANSGSHISDILPLHFVWSPSTTSECKIKLQYALESTPAGGVSIYLRLNTPATFRLLEIGAD